MLDEITNVERLQRINKALMGRVESQLDQQGNSFSLFQTALHLEGQVKRRTDELTSALHRLEKINDELAVAKEAAEIANQSKTSFLAAASHDILQPLNAALLSVSVLADLQTNNRGREIVSQIERSLENMNALLGTLLDISRLEAGVMQPTTETVMLDGVLQSIKSDFMPIAKAKNLDISFDTPAIAAKTDRTMLRRILQNLVSNALRYTQKGKVTLNVTQTGNDITILVEDTGRGISPAQQENVFEEFNRGDATGEPPDSSGAGLGLGLSIVKKMIDTLGHRLEMNSVPGRGTRFELTLPSVRLDPEGAASLHLRKRKVQADLSGIRILLLENDPAVIEAMLTLLKSWKCDVNIATNTLDAIRLVGDTENLPDIIIADQHLNQGDLGTNSLYEIWSYVGRRIPALVVSADPTETLETEVSDLGLELLVKPVKPATLRALVTHLTSC